LRGDIADDVLSNGWNKTVGSFTTTYADSSVDAALLHVGLSGLLPGDDPRFVATVSKVEKTLRRGPTVYRYLYDDGLPGQEGGFHLCTSWLIESLVMVNRLEDARSLFNDYVSMFGPTGLCPEEYCPRTRRSLGNHPQLYSHLGLINAALALSNANA
jgi:GH15 family glucan-1,4-alpha-glucosidase